MRPFDDPFMPNFADGCDIGADELTDPLLQIGSLPVFVTEGGPAQSFVLVLTEPPTANVTVAFTPSQVYVSVPTITFTPDNWNVRQAVGVAAIDDGNVEFTQIDYIEMGVVSSDPQYSNLPVGDIALQIRDNDAPMIHLPLLMKRYE